MKKEKLLSSLEYMILLVILQRKNYTYGIPIYEAICEAQQKDVAMAVIYSTLRGLKTKEFIEDQLEDATPERGGRAKRFYKVTGAGKAAVKRFEQGVATIKSFQLAFVGG